VIAWRNPLTFVPSLAYNGTDGRASTDFPAAGPLLACAGRLYHSRRGAIILSGGTVARVDGILTKLVREECAAYVRNGCLGIDPRSRPFREPGECSIFKGEPCSVFQRVILPIAKTRGEYQKASLSYFELDAKAGRGKGVRRCACGRELLPRKRFCPRCAKAKRAKTYREQKQHQRRQAVLQSGGDPESQTDKT